MKNRGPKNMIDIGEGWKPVSFYVGENKMFKSENDLDKYIEKKREEQHKALDRYFNLTFHY